MPEKESDLPNTKPPYSAAFRQQMIELVRAGRKPDALAREFGCNVGSIHAWMRQADDSDSSGNSNRQANAAANGVADAPQLAIERQELLEHRRRFKQVQMERDILAKTCVHGLPAKAR